MTTKTYSLLPYPIPRHEISKAMDSICSMFLEGRVIKFEFEVRIGQEIEDQSVRVPEPDIIISIHEETSLAGQVPSYCKLKDCQGMSPRGVESIVLYMCALVENGGVSL